MKHDTERDAFTLSKSLKSELEGAVPASQRSQFVEKAIADALLKDAKRKALESLKDLPACDTVGRDSVEVLRQVREERNDYLASRHQAAK